MPKKYFDERLFRFLKSLRRNNKREWFLEHKSEYVEHVQEPILAFLRDLKPELSKLHSRFVVNPKPFGGSMFRIYRDVRFSEDKSPYKTHASAWFRFRAPNPEAEGPGFYFHLQPGECFMGGGIWHPDARTLRLIRDRILEHPEQWERVRRSRVELGGESLTRPPRGYDPEHRWIEDLKRKDYIMSVDFTDAQICGPELMKRFIAACRSGLMLQEFLAKALRLPW
jgi:uncharacterized protein (TIGR02453 family)